MCRRCLCTNECRTPLMVPSPRTPPSPRTGVRNHYFLPLGHFSLVSVTILKSVVLKVTEVSSSQRRSVFYSMCYRVPRFCPGIASRRPFLPVMLHSIMLLVGFRYLSVCLSVCPSIHPSIYPSIHLSMYNLSILGLPWNIMYVKDFTARLGNKRKRGSNSMRNSW